MIAEMKRLVDKFPNGYEGTEAMKGSEVSAEEIEVPRVTESAAMADKETILNVSDEIISELEKAKGDQLEAPKGSKLSDTSESRTSKGVPDVDEKFENRTKMEEVSETNEWPEESATEKGVSKINEESDENPASKQNGINLELTALSLTDGRSDEIPAF